MQKLITVAAQRQRLFLREIYSPNNQQQQNQSQLINPDSLSLQNTHKHTAAMSFLESRMLESCLDTADVFDARNLSVSQHDENLNRKRREQQLLMEARIRNIKKDYQQKYEQIHSDYLLQCEQLKQQLQSEIKREMYTFECNIESFITKQMQGAEISRINNPNHSSFNYQNNPLNSTFHIDGEAGATALNDFRPYRSQHNNNISKNVDLDSSIVFNTSQNHGQTEFRRTMFTHTVPSQFGSFQEDEGKHTHSMTRPDYLLRTHFNENQENIFEKTSGIKDCYAHLAKTNPAAGSAFEKMRASSTTKKPTPNIRHILGEKSNNRIQYSENTTPQAWVRSPEWGTSGKKGFDLSWNQQKQQLQQSGLLNQGGFMSASQTTTNKQDNHRRQQQSKPQQASQKMNISYDENTFRSKEKQSFDQTRSKQGQYRGSNQQFSDSDSEEENSLDTLRLRRFKIENLSFSEASGTRGGKNQRLHSTYK